ncbi:MAG: flagellar hook-length control protein FliK [Xanthobacteraceae bacterium]
MSSTASNVSATPAVAPSPWPQTPAANQDNTQDNGGGPFAAMLDAAAASDTTQPTPQPAASRTSTAADQPAAKFSARRTNGTTGAAQTTTPGTQTSANATKNANAVAPPVANSNATVNPSPAQNAIPNQAVTAPTDTTGGGTALGVFAGAAAAAFAGAAANAATPDAATKTSSDNQDDSGSETDAGAAVAVATTDAQIQPVAAAIVANAVVNSAPAAAAAPDTAIGGSAPASAKPALPFVDANASSQSANDPSATPDAKTSAAGQDAKIAVSAQDAKIAGAAQDAKIVVPVQTAKVATPAQVAKPSTASKQPSSANSNDPIANADSAAATDSQAWNGSAAPQVQTRADSDTIITSQSGGAAATHIDALAATPASDAGGSPSAQSGWNAAKAATEGLPNFGIVANQAAPAAAAAAPGTAMAATVPIAGLAVAIASRAQAGSSQFDIRLDPPDLGRIDVRLDVSHDGQVTSHVTVDRADTLQLLQNQQPQLERALEQAGLKTADNGLQFTLRDQSFAGQNGNSGSDAQPSAAHLVIPDAEAPVIQAKQIYSRAGLGSGVDIRV